MDFFSKLHNENIRQKQSDADEGYLLSQEKSSLQFSALMEEDAGITPKNNQKSLIDSIELYDKASRYLDDAFVRVRNKKKFPVQDAIKIVEEIADASPLDDALFIQSIHVDVPPHEFLINHSVNLLIYAFKMAERLKFDRDETIALALAAMFHDIGTAIIPEDIIFKTGKLSDMESAIFQKRPEYSHKILSQMGEELSLTAECAFQVYERVDGSGYPRGLKGDEIHKYAQIIGVLDVYEALIHNRPQREKFQHFKAVKNMIQWHKAGFKRKYFKALLNIFSIFPLQSYVRLNSDAIGRVVETYETQPMRPMVQIVFDSNRKRVVAERFINLPENPLLYIKDSVSENELNVLFQ